MVIPVNPRLNRTLVAIVITFWLRVAALARIVHDALEIVTGIGFDGPARLDKALDEGGARALVFQGAVHGETEAVFGDAVAFCMAGAVPALC
jgi:hypothetical protein